VKPNEPGRCQTVRAFEVEITGGNPIKALASGFYKRGGFMRNIRFIVVVASIVLGNLGSTGMLSAQVATNGQYYEEVKAATCGNGCLIEFTPTPASGPRINFSKVNCFFANMTAGVVYLYFGVRDSSGASSRRIEYLPISQYQTTNGGAGLRFYTILAPTDMLFAPGRIPVIGGGTDGTVSGSLNCKITGHFEQ
jgi:hypothetical protein